MVVDFASGIETSKDHTVHLATNQYDPNYCFEECHDLKIRSYGWVRSFDRLSQIVSATLNSLLLSFYVILVGFNPESPILSYDVIFIDIIAVSAVIFKLYFGFLRMLDVVFSFYRPPKKYPLVLFYCHFPDLLLAKPKTLLHAMFRIPFDALEQFYMWFPDRIVFNSNFTRLAYERVFFLLAKIYPKDCIHLIYPAISKMKRQPASSIPDFIKKNFILSFNRFDTKKNLERAIYLCKFMKELITTEKVYFVIAGGFDPSNAENRSVLLQLQNLSQELDLSWTEGLTDARLDPSIDILFLKGVSASLKTELLASSKALFYTPSNEHFGITPLETMSFGQAVVFAMNSGGPAEYIQHKKTGYLIPDYHQEVTQESFLKTLSTEELSDLKAELEKTITRADSTSVVELKRTACEFAESSFKIDVCVSKLISIYEDEQKRTPRSGWIFASFLMSLLAIGSIVLSRISIS